MNEQWVLIEYWSYEPTNVYGLFSSDTEAYEYAKAQGFGVADESAYEVKMILNIHEE